MDERVKKSAGASDATTVISDVYLAPNRPSTIPLEETLPDALRAIRVHLGMEVAFISEFVSGRRQFKYVDSSSSAPPIAVGGSDPLEESYCQRVVDGRLPQLIKDATLLAAAHELAVTMALPVGAHLSVPIRLADGRVYGTFCCFSRKPDTTLTDRDLAMMQVFANFVAQQIDRHLEGEHAREKIAERVRAAIDASSFTILYQPIYRCHENRVIGFECLTQFSAAPSRTPDVWFKEAAGVGLSEALEMATGQKALAALAQLPEEVYVSLNVSPAPILSGAITRLLANAPLHRIVVELTEHDAIADYSRLATMLDPLRRQGLRLAVDDAGAGYASLRHILHLTPDIIKLDISLTRDIDSDHVRRALAAALIRFAEEIGSVIIAEGVETEAELRILRQLGVKKVQGFLTGRPMAIGDAIALV